MCVCVFVGNERTFMFRRCAFFANISFAVGEVDFELLLYTSFLCVEPPPLVVTLSLSSLQEPHI